MPVAEGGEGRGEACCTALPLLLGITYSLRFVAQLRVCLQEGGALSRMIPVFQIFAGGPLGSGRQWCSWIHRDDLVRTAGGAEGGG